MAVDVDKLAEAIAKAAKEYEQKYGYLPSSAHCTLSKSQTAVDTRLQPDEYHDVYNAVHEQEATTAIISKTEAIRELRDVAKSIRKQGQTHAQAVLAALENDPSLYTE